MKKFSLLFLLVIILLIFSQFSCNPAGPKPERDVVLKVEDASCTETWLKLTLNNFTGNTQVELKRNGNTVNTFNITTADTVLYDDSLAPNNNYTYQAVELQNGNETAKSEGITTTTLDTTSSNFTWQTFILGDGNSSAIHDVALINDTTAYVVGAIYYKDSTGQFDLTPYNLAVWNSKEWSIKHISFNLYDYDCSIAGSYYGNANTIYSFIYGNIIITDGTDFVKLYGASSSHYPCAINILKGSIKKIWGKSVSDFYSVGTNGTIIHFINDTWQNIESGTTLNITDAYGAPNSSDIYMSLYNESFSLPRNSLLKFSNNNVEIQPTPDNLAEASSIWLADDNILFISGTGLFRRAFGTWSEITDFGRLPINRIRGNGLNDIFVAGSHSIIAHFNGVAWTRYTDLNINNAVFGSIAAGKNIVIIAGFLYDRSIVVIGKRQ